MQTLLKLCKFCAKTPCIVKNVKGKKKISKDYERKVTLKMISR